MVLKVVLNCFDHGFSPKDPKLGAAKDFSCFGEVESVRGSRFVHLSKPFLLFRSKDSRMNDSMEIDAGKDAGKVFATKVFFFSSLFFESRFDFHVRQSFLLNSPNQWIFTRE